MKKLLTIGLLLLTCFSKQDAFAQPITKGTTFWVSFMEDLDLLSNGPDALSFLIASDVNTSGTVSLPAAGYTQNFTVAAGQVTNLLLPAIPYYAIGSEQVDTMGFLITTNDPVTVTAYHQRSYFSDASIVLPAGELGDAYLVMAHSDDFYSLTSGKSAFVIAATENQTIVDITPSTLTLGGRPAAVAFSVTLSKGETYQVQAIGDLTGTYIKAREGKKIAMFSGSRTAGVGCSYADNHLYDQAYPVSNWGMEYMVCPFYVQSNIFRVLASENQTDVYINCTLVKTLDKEQYFDTLLSVPVHLVTTRPVAVGEFERGSDCSFQIGDPNFLWYAPLSHVAKKRTFNALVSDLPNTIFPYHFVTVFVKTTHVNAVLLDNVAIPGSFSAVPANPGYAFGVIDLTGGTHTLVCDSGFSAFVTGFRNYDAYSYTLGYDAVRSSPELVLAHDSDSLCMNHTIHFDATTTGNATAWTWSFGDGGSSTDQHPSHVYAGSGIYHVTLATLDGTGCPYTAETYITINDCTPAVEDCEVYVPNAFSPNNDGINDITGVHGPCVKTIDFKIYDRWGTEVFHSTDPAHGWDGKYKGVSLESAVFVWTLSATTNAGTVIKKSGSISLIR